MVQLARFHKNNDLTGCCSVLHARVGANQRGMREDFTGIAVPFYESHLRADTLPQFRAMNAALSRAIAGTGG